jgi:hypothetical protein
MPLAIRRHRPFFLAMLGCVAVYAVEVALFEVRPGNVWAIGYGVAALALLLVAALYGVRRRAMGPASRRKVGSSAAWLRLHVYGSWLFLLLVLMHGGFSLPRGWVTWWLWGLSLWTVASGVAGQLLQRWIPRLLTSGLSVEAHYDRIPELVADLRRRAGALAEGASLEVRSLYERVVAPELSGPTRRPLYFLDITGGIQSKLRDFRYLRGFLAEKPRAELDELERLYRSKLELDAHYTLQLPLRWWLYLHLPVAMLLVVFVVLHLVSVLLY